MAPSWIVNDSAGPEIFQPVKSLLLKRLVKPGSTTGAVFCKPTASISGRNNVQVRMRGSLPPSGAGVDCALRIALMKKLTPLPFPLIVVLLTIAAALGPGHAQDTAQN